MAKLEFLLSFIIGLTIFLTDLIYGWLTLISSPIPVIFIIALIIGIVAGSHGEAVLSTMITWVGGILIGVIIAPIVFAEIWNPDQTFLGSLLFVFLYSVRGFYTLTYEGNIVEVLVTGLIYFIAMLIITPILYLFSFAFAPIGVVIGKFIRKLATGRSEKQSPVIRETPGLQSTPVVERLVEDEEDPYDDSES